MARTSDATIGRTEIPLAALRLLWATDWWDGPTAGVALANGEPCYFKAADEDEHPPPRCCVVWRLTAGQFEELKRWHDLFREHVGSHTDFDADGRRHPGSLRPQVEHSRFYDAYATRRPLELTDDAVIGYCWM